MKFKPLTYRIANYIYKDHWHAKTVTGFAVDCGLPVMLCVREDVLGWTCDEYTTGFSICAYGMTKESAAQNAVRVIKKNMKTGKWESALRAAKVILSKRKP